MTTAARQAATSLAAASQTPRIETLSLGEARRANWRVVFAKLEFMTLDLVSWEQSGTPVPVIVQLRPEVGRAALALDLSDGLLVLPGRDERHLSV